MNSPLGAASKEFVDTKVQYLLSLVRPPSNQKYGTLPDRVRPATVLACADPRWSIKYIFCLFPPKRHQSWAWLLKVVWAFLLSQLSQFLHLGWGAFCFSCLVLVFELGMVFFCFFQKTFDNCCCFYYCFFTFFRRNPVSFVLILRRIVFLRGCSCEVLLKALFSKGRIITDFEAVHCVKRMD